MDFKQHKLISIAYDMYVMEDGQKILKEKAEEKSPYTFISGLGYTIDALEKKLFEMNDGDSFSITVENANACGEYDKNMIVELDKEQFIVDGKLDIEEGMIVPLRDPDNNVFQATVEEINDTKVILDMNHPYAGYDLTFEGKVLVSRQATEKEINHFLTMMTGGGCGCGECGGGNCGGSHDSCGCGGGCC